VSWPVTLEMSTGFSVGGFDLFCIILCVRNALSCFAAIDLSQIHVLQGRLKRLCLRCIMWLQWERRLLPGVPY
jgi:hypothetical protein